MFCFSPWFSFLDFKGYMLTLLYLNLLPIFAASHKIPGKDNQLYIIKEILKDFKGCLLCSTTVLKEEIKF